MSSAEAKKLALIAVGVVLALPLLAATGGGSAGAALAALSYLGQSGLPRGMRNNNPGNIRISGNAWQGKIPVSNNTDGAFEQFKTYVYGIRAMILNLRSYFNGGNNTLRKIITKWAPAADNNDTAAYIFTVSAKTGFGPDQFLTFDQGTLRKLVRAIAFVENGRDAVTDQQFNYAWGLATGSGIGAIYEEIPEIYRCNDGTWQISETEKAIKAKTRTLTDQGATKNDLARILAPLEATLRNLRSDYQRLLQKRSEVIEYSKREARLFGRKKRKYGRRS